ncbi:MAG: hypothetical protein JJ992_19585 [Planctomycetes bacterium]|nr:hypothetical protein [Planctomycetota bacterium]
MSHDRDQNCPPDGPPAGHAASGPSEALHDSVEMPLPTIWPLVAALGITLALAGVVTSYVFTAGGILLMAVAGAGWIRELLPGAGEQRVAFVPPAQRAPSIRPKSRPSTPVSPPPLAHRARLPETVPPYTAGIAGGIAGGVAMAAVALVYGLVSGRGIWYPVNLLAAMLLPGAAEWNVAQLERFQLGALMLGLLIHGTTSLGVGLMFALLFPMLPGRPLIWGGLVGPLLWSTGIYAFMGVLNPVMNSRVDWIWFIVSQFAFGLTTGFVVGRTKKVPSSDRDDNGPLHADEVNRR